MTSASQPPLSITFLLKDINNISSLVFVLIPVAVFRHALMELYLFDWQLVRWHSMAPPTHVIVVKRIPSLPPSPPPSLLQLEFSSNIQMGSDGGINARQFFGKLTFRCSNKRQYWTWRLINKRYGENGIQSEFDGDWMSRDPSASKRVPSLSLSLSLSLSWMLMDVNSKSGDDKDTQVQTRPIQSLQINQNRKIITTIQFNALSIHCQSIVNPLKHLLSFFPFASVYLSMYPSVSLFLLPCRWKHLSGSD